MCSVDYIENKKVDALYCHDFCPKARHDYFCSCTWDLLALVIFTIAVLICLLHFPTDKNVLRRWCRKRTDCCSLECKRSNGSICPEVQKCTHWVPYPLYQCSIFVFLSAPSFSSARLTHSLAAIEIGGTFQQFSLEKKKERRIQVFYPSAVCSKRSAYEIIILEFLTQMKKSFFSPYHAFHGPTWCSLLIPFHYFYVFCYLSPQMSFTQLLSLPTLVGQCEERSRYSKIVIFLLQGAEGFIVAKRDDGNQRISTCL